MAAIPNNTTGAAAADDDSANHKWKQLSQEERDEIERSANADRVHPSVPAPPLFPLTTDDLFGSDSGTVPDLKVLREHLLREGRLTPECAYKLIGLASQQFQSEPNILELQYPITVCGDVHGQYFDLIKLFDVGGDPSDTRYLFLGDYVDRGCFSTEVVFYLFALKIVYGETLFMLRGNHECRQLTAFFNFKDECAYKYTLELYDSIMDAFDYLPIAAIVNNAFFCVHGGLSPDVTTLDDIRAIDRHQEIPREGPMCDLLWSDPYEVEQPVEDEPDSVDQTTWFGYNETRQCSYVYGVEAVKRFLKDNKLTSIIRAHEAQADGYKMQMVNRSSGIPRVITIFSAPNYCDVYGNKAACLKFDNNVLNIKQFVDSDHPYYLPNFMNVFQWSLPFVAEKVTDMLASLLAFGDEDEPEEDAKETVVERRGGLLRKKVLAVTKLLRVYRILREQNETLVQLKQLTPSQRIPFGLLRAGPSAIKKVLSSFDNARDADLVNEAMPTREAVQTSELHRRTNSSGNLLSANSSGNLLGDIL
jgi:serine/threonine-protein phosphatase 2B catalytic subunit